METTAQWGSDSYCFICPVTGRRCRKLHLMPQGFRHRSAIRGGLYRAQRYSRKLRDHVRIPVGIIKHKTLGRLYKKYFKWTYRQNLTIPASSLMRKLTAWQNHLQVLEDGARYRFLSDQFIALMRQNIKNIQFT